MFLFSCRPLLLLRRMTSTTTTHPKAAGKPTVGLVDPTDLHHFSGWMDLPATAAAAHRAGRTLFAAAGKDAAAARRPIGEHLRQVRSVSEDYIHNDVVRDREAIKKQLNAIAASSDAFVLLTGGKSVGKSLLLKDLKKRHRGHVFIVDLRTHGCDIARGLHSVLQAELGKADYLRLLSDVTRIGTRLTLGADIDLHRIAQDFRGDRAGAPPPPLAVAIEALIMGMPVGEAPTIVLDEANIALSLDSEEDVHLRALRRRQVLDALALFTRLTKQEKRINVIMASSEHAFPFLLDKLGFNLQNITKFIHVSELPPSQMRLLNGQVGSHLGDALMTFFGGHIYDTFRAIRELEEQGGSLNLFTVLGPAPMYNVQDCAEYGGDSPADEKMRLRLRRLLKLLAVRGVAGMANRREDLACAEVISRMNIGSVLSTATISNLLPNWNNAISFADDDSDGRICHSVIVPATQSMRIVIATYLADSEKLLQQQHHQQQQEE